MREVREPKDPEVGDVDSEKTKLSSWMMLIGKREKTRRAVGAARSDGVLGAEAKEVRREVKEGKVSMVSHEMNKKNMKQVGTLKAKEVGT